VEGTWPFKSLWAVPSPPAGAGGPAAEAAGDFSSNLRRQDSNEGFSPIRTMALACVLAGEWESPDSPGGCCLLRGVILGRTALPVRTIVAPARRPVVMGTAMRASSVSAARRTVAPARPCAGTEAASRVRTVPNVAPTAAPALRPAAIASARRRRTVSIAPPIAVRAERHRSSRDSNPIRGARRGQSLSGMTGPNSDTGSPRRHEPPGCPRSHQGRRWCARP
jgi:hypothetical protein